MGYCRFKNTEGDLDDCLEHINDDLSDSPEEEESRDRLIETCKEILEQQTVND